MVKSSNVLILLFCLFFHSIAFGEIIGDMEYEIKHNKKSKELEVKTKCFCDGKAYFYFPRQFKKSDLETQIKDIKIKGKAAFFNKQGYLEQDCDKETIEISYKIANSKPDFFSSIFDPDIREEGFYFGTDYLISPANHVISKDFLLSFKFDLPKNERLFCTSGIVKNGRIDLKVEMAEPGYIFESSFFIGGSTTILKANDFKMGEKTVKFIFFDPLEWVDGSVHFHSKMQASYEAVSKFFIPLTKDYIRFKNPESPLVIFLNSENLRIGRYSTMEAFNANGSVIVDLSPAKAMNDVTVIATHEYIHNWIYPSVVNKSDSNYFDKLWESLAFSEGFTEYYSWKINYKAGLVSKAAVIEKYNYTLITPFSSLRASDLVKVAKETPSTVYNKGFLLASELDAKVKKATSGRKSLDDAMAIIMPKIGSGSQFSFAMLKSALKQTAGDSFDKLFEDIDSGRYKDWTVSPIGIEVRLKEKAIYIPDYGFDFAKSIVKEKITDLKKNSPAYNAGLREGNEYRLDKNGSIPILWNPTAEISVQALIGDRVFGFTVPSKKILVPCYELIVEK